LFIVHEFPNKEAVQNGQTKDIPIGSSFLLIISSFIKLQKKIIMATHQQKQQFASASRRMLLPLALLLVIAFTAKAEKNKFSVSQLVNPERQDTVNASFPGGEREQAKYLSLSINTDKHLNDSIYNRQGTIRIQFTVDDTGNLKDFVPIEDGIPYITSLITQSLKEGPVWTPKKINGKSVPSTQEVHLKVSIDKWRIMRFEF
jgi:hypothetical protein